VQPRFRRGVSIRRVAASNARCSHRYVNAGKPSPVGMRRVCTKLGFTFSKVPDSNTIYAEIAL